VRDPLWKVGLMERYAIEKTQRADRLVQRRPRHSAGNQMDLEGAHILKAQLIGRAAKEPAELCDRVDIGSLRCW
jgi:hypothetical protein